jgi:phosphatidylinositol-3,4,5-trisphosphate 3-phosphatase/dual-specificity protein phosphatase PTEN
MEQKSKADKMNVKDTPAIVVHCKAGKGRTGMMISAICLFISMFKSAEESINHYNRTRVTGNKGLTIASQKRYVKFMEGFLFYELIIN